MLTSKQRAKLKGLASTADTIFQIGKGGVSEQLVTEISAALKARELIKCKVLENSDCTPAQVAMQLSEECKAETVQVIGSKFVLYKRNEKKPVIVL